MTLYIIIFISALVGGYLNGIGGFFVWGIIAFVAVLLVGIILQKISGGILPKKVRAKTASDYVAEKSDLITSAWPSHSSLERTKEVQRLLEAMYQRAVSESKSFHPDAPGELEHFVDSANLVASEQNSEETKAVAEDLINYLISHPLWYGHVRNPNNLLKGDAQKSRVP